MDQDCTVSPRLQQLAGALRVERYPLCIAKLKIVIETMQDTVGQPQMWRRAQCLARVLERMPIFIEEGGGATRAPQLPHLNTSRAIPGFSFLS